MKSKRSKRKDRRRRYKKKKLDLFLSLKIALICYLAIFGVGYMSSDTSAYLSSQSEFSQMITAGIWEVPQVLGCGEELIEETELNREDKVENSTEETGKIALPGEEINVDREDIDDNPIEESEKDVIPSEENEVDCGDKDGNDSAGEVDCKGEDDSLVGEKDAASSMEEKTYCEHKDDESNEGNEIEKAPEVVEPIEPIIEKQNEIEDVDNEAEKENAEDSKKDELPKSNDESQKQPDGKDESVNESSEKNDAEIQEKNIKKAEGDTNEI